MARPGRFRLSAEVLAAAAVAIAIGGCGGGGDSTQTQPDAEPSASAGSSKADATSGSGDPARAKLVKVGHFAYPLALASTPDGSSTYVVERGGRIRSLTSKSVLLDLRDKVDTDGEGGLLSVAFDPDYRSSGRFFVSYSAHDALRVVSYRVVRGHVPAGSRRQVLTVPHPNDIHWGGQLSFGPDGYLYLATGDGGPVDEPPDTAQDLTSLRGKLLRIDPSTRGGYSIPADNPLVGKAGRDEIYAWGLRNPWRYSFDTTTKRIWIGDVGYGSAEEIDSLPLKRLAGANFGWPNYEGRIKREGGLDRSSLTWPRYSYDHHSSSSTDPCAVTGGYVVRDRGLGSLYGHYLFGDFCQGEILTLDDGQADALDKIQIPGLASFAEINRRLYAISLRGPIYRLAAG